VASSSFNRAGAQRYIVANGRSEEGRSGNDGEQGWRGHQFGEMVMELRHFRYFIAVAETLNVNQASHRLHVTQPALSRQIRDLEQELGCTLFDRLPHGVSLTEAGKSFLAGARQALAATDRARIQAQRTARGEVGTLRIGYNEVAFARACHQLSQTTLATSWTAARKLRAVFS
jgi:hypothetical protein